MQTRGPAAPLLSQETRSAGAKADLVKEGEGLNNSERIPGTWGV